MQGAYSWAVGIENGAGKCLISWMRKLVLSALILSAYPLVSMGQVTEGQWTYVVENGEAIIRASTATGVVTIPSLLGGYAVKELGYNAEPVFRNNKTFVTSVVIPNSVRIIHNNTFSDCTGLTSINIPNSVTLIGAYAFVGCTGLTSINIPNSVTVIGENAFRGCTGLTSVTMPDRFISQVGQFGLSGEVANDYLVNALANNDAFVTAVANKILAKSDNYGLAVKSELETLATYSELTSSLAQSRTDGINSVLSNPNLWTLYTTSQIQNMAVGDLVLTRQMSGGFVLNYDIEQSADLQTWTTYAPLSLPLTGLPTDKAFVRIKAKQ